VARRTYAGVFDRVLAAFHDLASYWILAIMGWIVVDVAGRAFLDHSLPGTAEIVAYSLPVITFLQIPYVLHRGQHLRSPLFDERLSSRARTVLVVLASVLGATLFGLAAYSTWQPMLNAWRAGEYIGEGVIHIPAGPAWTTIFTSCTLMTMQFLGTLAKNARALLRALV
jgi:TRAP-type C4-dicarboxylate transport system permease small subunit